MGAVKRQREREVHGMPGEFPGRQMPKRQRKTMPGGSVLSILTSPLRSVYAWLTGTTTAEDGAYNYADLDKARKDGWTESQGHSVVHSSESITRARGSRYSEGYRERAREVHRHKQPQVRRERRHQKRRMSEIDTRWRRRPLISNTKNQHLRTRFKSNNLVKEVTSRNLLYNVSSSNEGGNYSGYLGLDTDIQSLRNNSSSLSSDYEYSVNGFTTPSKDASRTGDSSSILSIDSNIPELTQSSYSQDWASPKGLPDYTEFESRTSLVRTLDITRAGMAQLNRGNTDTSAWFLRVRGMIRSTLALTEPSKEIQTPIFDRIRKAERDFDTILEEARQRMTFTLPKDAQKVIKNAMRPGFSAEVNNVPVTFHDVDTLGDGNWLNDEVINFYMQLIISRSQCNKALPKVHAFNTFFYSTLKDKGYTRVRRWTRRINLFEMDMVIIPVHLGVHWCCAVIDFRKKAIAYYDSLLGNNTQCLRLLLNYLREESKDKLKSEFDESGWTLSCPKDIPQQQNGYDCGVFASTFAEYLSRNADFGFSQQNCQYLRQKMIYEIATKSLVAIIV